MNIEKHHPFESHRYNSKFQSLDINTFVPRIDSMIIIYVIYFVFFAYYFIFNNNDKARTTLVNVAESKAVFIGLLCVIFLHLYFNSLVARNHLEKAKIQKFRDAIHLGIIASVIALLDRMDIVMGQFFVISFIYYFLGEIV